MYFLLAPFTVGLAVPLLHQVRGLLRDTGDRGPARSVQVWTVALVAVPVLVVCGHGEDALALLGLLVAVRLAIGQRWTAAGLALGVAVASKQWALLALPALVALSPRRERPRLAAASLALPATVGLLTLAVDWTMPRRRCSTRPTIPATGMPPSGSTPARRPW
jgi:Glycosyltransferase family 87